MKSCINSNPVVIVYRRRDRDISSLEAACEDLDLHLTICESMEDVKRELEGGNVSVLIANFGPESRCTANQDEFMREVGPLFRPEDASILLVYSFDRTTPHGWKRSADPRTVIRVILPLEQAFEDKSWSNTIEKLRRFHSEHAIRRTAISRNVEVAIGRDSETPFPTEAKSLLKASFCEMRNVNVQFRKQGLSNSIGLVIQPFDLTGTKAGLRFFGKLYRDESRAFVEYRNWHDYIDQQLPPIHYPSCYRARYCKGIALSLSVTELLEGPNGETITFRDMVESNEYSFETVERFLLDVLITLQKYFSCPSAQGPINLIREYLKNCLDKPERKRSLESEIFSALKLGNHWDGLSLEDRLTLYVSNQATEGKRTKKAHGDMHADNIMVRAFRGTLIPAFIDFSRTGPTKHYLVDHVTLEGDLIINSFDQQDISQFLSLLNPANDQAQAVSENESHVFRKILTVTRLLRKDALESYGAQEVEYSSAALLKTLDLLSYGSLTSAKTDRAIQYASYLIGKIKTLSRT